MLKIKAKRQLRYSPEFFDRCTSLFLGFESGHMGSDMYYDHQGMRIHTEQGLTCIEPMSGVLTWEDHAQHGTIPYLAQQFFVANLDNVAEIVGEGLPIVEYGPGSMEDARQLIQATKSRIYIPADLSEGIISQAAELAATVEGCQVRPAIMDLFASDNVPLIDEPALAALLGGTISNIPGPAPKIEPREALIRAFRNLKKPIGQSGGYLLVSTHAEQDGEHNKELYNEEWHRKFGVNFLYRMQDELPMNGFKPDYFEYQPVWHEHCGLLAHCIRATHDQTFIMGGFDEIKISVTAGDVFHYNNSFKYKPTFFESCANTAGLKPIKKWEDKDSMMLYLFEVSPVYKMQAVPRSLTTSSVYSLAV